MAQRLRRHLHQPGGQPDRRLVGQAAEHHMAHLCRLGMQGGVQSGVRIAVDGGPPGGHSVDQLGPAFDWPRQAQACPGRGFDEERLMCGGHRPIGMPDVRLVERKQAIRRQGCPAAQAHLAGHASGATR